MPKKEPPSGPCIRCRKLVSRQLTSVDLRDAALELGWLSRRCASSKNV